MIGVSTKKKTMEKSRKRKGITPGFFVLMCLILFGTMGFTVLQNKLSVSTDLKAREVDTQTAAERDRQKTLRIELARLNSPTRVARIAQDELDMAEPEAVIYLKYLKDTSGVLACQSTYEQWSVPVPEEEKEGKQEVVEEEPVVEEQEVVEVENPSTTSLEPSDVLSQR